MNYRLVVLTHGDNAVTLVETLGAFTRLVKPAPAEAVIWIDGGYAARAMRYWDFMGYSPWPWTHDGTEEQRGFCAATRSLWEIAARPSVATRNGCEHVLWLEHDFLITRPVDLRELAGVLDAHPMLAQMALMRDAVNTTEKAAGGLFESRRGQYEPRRHVVYADDLDAGDQMGAEVAAHPWLEHHAYLTTNVNLMRRQFMVDNPWPDYLANCEGLFGIDLLGRGYSFGVWGSGEPWTTHIGTRSGFGY